MQLMIPVTELFLFGYILGCLLVEMIYRLFPLPFSVVRLSGLPSNQSNPCFPRFLVSFFSGFHFRSSPQEREEDLEKGEEDVFQIVVAISPQSRASIAEKLNS